MEVKQETVLDLIDQQSPALSSVSDMPLIETKPDSVAAPEPAPVEQEEAEPTEESATSPDSPSANDDKPKAKGVQKRLDELVKQREDAERRAEQEREEKLRVLKLLEERGKPAQVEEEVPADDEPIPPSRHDFTDPDEYDLAMLTYSKENAEWAARTAVKRYESERKKQEELRSIEEGQRVAREAFAERVSKAQDKYADFKEVTENSEVQISMPMVHAIIHSEQGPDLQYHLAKHPEEVKRLMSLTPPEQLMEMGKIVARMETPSLVTKPVSAAPPPIRPSKPGTEPSLVPDEELSMEAYAAKWKERNKGMRH